MAINSIEQIKQAESEAVETVNASAAEAKRILADAKNQAEELRLDILQNARDNAIASMDKAKAEGEQTQAIALVEINRDIQQLADRSYARKQNAIDRILNTLVIENAD